MNTNVKLRRFVTITFLYIFLPTDAHAQLSLSVGTEYFKWEEDTSPDVTEEGALFAFGISYTQERSDGPLLGYRGRLWTGTVDYTGSTLFSGQPIMGSTGYFGFTNELQGRWRRQLQVNNSRLDIVAGAGIDAWRRELSSVQREDFLVVYVRTGIVVDAKRKYAWILGAGVKFPVWIREDAHLTNIGFDSNPRLNPGGRLSAYAQLGYRFSNALRIIGYADGYHFSRSNEVNVTEIKQGLGNTTLFQPASEMLVLGIKLEYIVQ